MSAAPSSLDLDAPRLYINRELSLLAFFERVLAMAALEDTPPLERLRFLTICSTILDEFFEIRVAGLKQRARLKIARPGPDGLSPQEALRRIADVVKSFVREQYRLLNGEVLGGLRALGVKVLKRSEWTKKQRKWVRAYFNEQVAPVLTPVGLDPAHPFPRLLNKSLNLFMTLEGADAFGRQSDYAVMHVPRCLPRVIQAPHDVADAPHVFFLLSSVIHEHVGEVFPGMKVTGCHQFRVTRNADLWVEEEEVEDLLDALKGQLPHRRYGDAVRLEVDDTCPREHAEFLLQQFGLEPDDLYVVKGPVNLHRMVAVYEKVDRPELQFPGFTPTVRWSGDLFEVISRGDVLLHHPYESFTPVVDLLRQAADDPDVLAVKATVYRTGTRSAIVQALLDAARQGKEITAVIELRARFEEEANIDLATRLQAAGANVVYGVVGYKTHCKMLLVVRREGSRLRRYVHLGTGNYHAGTARAYTDFGFMTCRPDIAEDVHLLFTQLTGLGRAEQLSKLLQSPFTLQPGLLEHIAAEAVNARAGEPAWIKAKVNSISDPIVIRALYEASQAGVRIDLVVRGICCLRPGVDGVSENIRVVSILGRFLEHSRIYAFCNGGDERVYLASADLMGRNLYRRIETCFPIEEPALAARVLEEGVETYLRDNSSAWALRADGEYAHVAARDPDTPQLVAQETLLALLSDR